MFDFPYPLFVLASHVCFVRKIDLQTDRPLLTSPPFLSLVWATTSHFDYCNNLPDESPSLHSFAPYSIFSKTPRVALYIDHVILCSESSRSFLTQSKSWSPYSDAIRPRDHISLFFPVALLPCCSYQSSWTSQVGPCPGVWAFVDFSIWDAFPSDTLIVHPPPSQRGLLYLTWQCAPSIFLSYFALVLSVAPIALSFVQLISIAWLSSLEDKCYKRDRAFALVTAVAPHLDQCLA